jgi:uncharacterized protein (TIGR00661 family)
MNILYGVCGEGMGHAMRSAVVASHLVDIGHNLRFVSSNNAHRYLSKRWPGKVSYALGLYSVLAANRVQTEATLLTNVVVQTLGSLMHVATFLTINALERQPNVVISDFEPWTANYAYLMGIPLIAVDNIHFMNRCTHPIGVVSPDREAAAIAFPVVNRKVLGARRYLVTTFVGAPVSSPRTTLHYPILRPSILAARPSIGSHVCAYFNNKADHARIAGVLHQVPATTFHLYGSQRVGVDGNVDYRSFTEDEFIRDVADSSAVIGGAGFTFMTEAIHLGKPMLAVPFSGSFEQILNSNYLSLMGYGERAYTLDATTVSGFIGRSNGYRQNLSKFRHDGNVGLLRAVDEALSEVA